MHFVRVSTPDKRLLEGAADSIEAIPETIKSMLIVLKAEWPDVNATDLILVCNFGASHKSAAQELMNASKRSFAGADKTEQALEG